MKHLIAVIFLLSIVVKPSLSQEKKSYDRELFSYTISDKDFEKVLIQSVDYLKKCNGYDSTIVFKVVNVKKNQHTYFSITCSKQRDILLNDLSGIPYGYFSFQRHLFLIFGDTTSNWLSRTDEKDLFSINREPSTYQLEHPPEWAYEFIKGKFVLIKMINECVNDRKKRVKFR